MFLAVDTAGQLGIYNSTAHNNLLVEPLGEGGDPEVGDAGTAGAEQGGGEVHDQLVDEPGTEEGGGEGGCRFLRYKTLWRKGASFVTRPYAARASPRRRKRLRHSQNCARPRAAVTH